MKTIIATFQKGGEPLFKATGTFKTLPGKGDVIWHNLPEEYKSSADSKNYAEMFENSMEAFASHFGFKVSFESEGDWRVFERQAKSYLQKIISSAVTGDFTETNIRAIGQQFASLIPYEVARALPGFHIQIVDNPNSNVKGSWDPKPASGNLRTLKLNKALLQADPNRFALQRTLVHELAHWLHLHGPPWYRKVIRDLYHSLTLGSKLEELPNYKGCHGRPGPFYDEYASREYDIAFFEGTDARPDDGVEVPSKYLELLADPDGLNWATDPASNKNAID